MTQPVRCPACQAPLTPVFAASPAPRGDLLYWLCECGSPWSADQIQEYLEKSEHPYSDVARGQVRS